MNHLLFVLQLEPQIKRFFQQSKEVDDWIFKGFEENKKIEACNWKHNILGNYTYLFAKNNENSFKLKVGHIAFKLLFIWQNFCVYL